MNWIREQIETPEAVTFTKADKMRMLDRLCWSDHFEAFLAQKYGHKARARFGRHRSSLEAAALQSAAHCAPSRLVPASAGSCWLALG